MDQEKSLKECLGWDSPIGLAIFFTGTGILLWCGMRALQMLTAL